MKAFFHVAIAFLAIFALYTAGDAQVRGQKHPGRARKIDRDPAMTAAAKDAHQAHLPMKSALPIYDGHRVLAMELCGLADRDIREGLTGVPTAPPANFANRKQLKANKNREKPLMKYSSAQIQASNADLQNAVPMIQAAIQSLSKAAGDY